MFATIGFTDGLRGPVGAGGKSTLGRSGSGLCGSHRKGERAVEGWDGGGIMLAERILSAKIGRGGVGRGRRSGDGREVVVWRCGEMGVWMWWLFATQFLSLRSVFDGRMTALETFWDRRSVQVGRIGAFTLSFADSSFGLSKRFLFRELLIGRL